MHTISYIPPEILSCILDHLPSEDLLPLRTVSSTFLHLTSRRIFSEITIKLDAINFSVDQLKLIEFLSTSSSTTGSSIVNALRNVAINFSMNQFRLIKSLSTSSSTTGSSIVNAICNVAIKFTIKQLRLIKSLPTSSSFNGSSIVNSLRNVALFTRRNRWENEHDFLIIGQFLKAVLTEHLALFLTRLQNLETVDWTHHVDQEPSLYLIAIAQSLSSHAKLRNVAITIKRHDNDNPSLENYKLPPLHTFKNLASLSVSCSEDIPTAYCNREIATAIAASPKLTRLSLKNLVEADANISVTKTSSLQTLFGNGATSPQLIELELRHVPLPAAGLSQMLSHRLKSLTISTPTGSRQLDFAWAELFTTLEEIGVELSQLSVSGMEAAMDEMFSYLLSFAAGGRLQTLEIRNIMMDCQNQEESAGHRFWNEIVPHHCSSLRVLSIQPCYEGEWCYGPEVAAAIRQFSSLRNLTVAVRSVDSTWAKAELSLASANKATENLDLEEPDNLSENSTVPQKIPLVSANEEIKYLYLKEPYGLPENSAALILNDFSYPLAQLTLTVVDQASTRAQNIDCLNRGIRRRDTNLDAELERLREIRFNIDELFLGLRATPVVGGVWESWPLKVFVAGKYIGHNGFRLGRCKLGGESGDDCGKWCYRRYE